MLSIIVPVRDESDSLKDILDYFSKNLININYEVLIINDFSKDNTLENARNLFDKSENFKVFNNKKKGLGGAINLGIKESVGINIAIVMAITIAILIPTDSLIPRLIAPPNPFFLLLKTLKFSLLSNKFLAFSKVLSLLKSLIIKTS